MTPIENYMYDGANSQAAAVLAYVREMSNTAVDKTWDQENKRPIARIYAGRYENCREQGYVISICYKRNQRNYAVYEHRNSDEICVLISNKVTLNTPGIAEVWADKGPNATKYDVDKYFEYGDILGCGEWIIKDIESYLDELIAKEQDNGTAAL